MKLQMPYTPKARLAEILVRRGQTLKSYVQELGITSAVALEVHCNKHKLVMPDTNDLIDAFAPPPPKVAHREPLIVEVPTVLSRIETQLAAMDAEETKKKGKRIKNALVQLDGENSASEPEKKED